MRKKPLLTNNAIRKQCMIVLSPDEHDYVKRLAASLKLSKSALIRREVFSRNWKCILFNMRKGTR
jgi:hypothetical protein